MAEGSQEYKMGDEEGAGEGQVPVFDDEEGGDDEAELIRGIGDHPLMERVQAALNQQLTEAAERVSLELREKEEDLRRAKVGREDVGVQLYGVQQQLAKLQMELEERHNEFNAVASSRVKAEEDTVNAQQTFKETRAEIATQREKLAKNQNESDALNATLRQVEQYNEEMKSEIAVTRRATYKAEETVTDLEKKKEGQDLYIDTLNEQLKSLHEQLALYEAQLVSQQQETKAAHDTLNDAAKEMDAISFEKKQLMQQWKSSLIGMQRRDEALQATLDALREQREEESAIEQEVDGYKGLISNSQEANERLVARRDQVENESKFLEEQIELARAERDKLSERFTMLKKSLEQTDAEHGVVVQEQERLIEQTGTLEQNMQVVVRERQKLFEYIEQNKSTQTTVSKAAKNLAKSAAKVQEGINEKELELESMHNEHARVQVDVLNTNAHNSKLKETLVQYVDELKEKDGLIEKYELEIRQRNDEIEKKMYIVDRLNRRYEALTDGVEDENMGPLEATIKNLGKSIDKSAVAVQQLQRQWLQGQTELVTVANDTEDKVQTIHDLSSKETILNQKKLRLDSAITKAAGESGDLQKAIRGMMTDMGRLNTLIAQNKDAREEISNVNFALESEFLNELREMEADSIRMEAQVAAVKEEKNRVLEEIVELERQVMLWEKKIQLEKETQAALDPEVGQAESNSMEKEIHRMKLRYDALKRDQERMIKDMERAIFKREAIANRNRGKEAVGGHGAAEMTQAALTKKTNSLRVSLKEASADTKGHDAAIKQKLEEMEAIGGELEQASSTYSQLEDQAHQLQQTINDSLYDKQRHVDLIQRYQRIAKRYQQMHDGANEPVDEAVADAEVRRAEEEQHAVQTIIAKLQGEHPHLEELLGRVYNLSEFSLVAVGGGGV